MAHFAKVNKSTNLVEQVIVATQAHIFTLPDHEDWVQTSYNTLSGVHKQGGIPLRKNFAGIGYTYDRVKDAFIPPKPFASWTLDEDTCQWNPPTEKPSGDYWKWNEETQTWDAVE